MENTLIKSFPIKRPVPEKLHWFRRLLALLPGFCRHCGKRFIACHTDYPGDRVLAIPKGLDGRICPDHHEGCLIGFDIHIREYFVTRFNNITDQSSFEAL